MKHLNNIPEFHWVSVGNNDQNLAKTFIGGECFWLRECKQRVDGVWEAFVDNQLLLEDEHGLNLDDKVTFTINEK